MKPVKTLYWDDKTKQFVYIIWDGKIAKPHRLPKTVFTEKDARKYLKDNRIGV